MEPIKFDKRIAILLLLLLIIPLGSSALSDTNPIYTKDKDAFISHPIRVNNAVDTSIVANITVKNQAKNPIIPSSAMVYNISSQEHEFTIDAGNLTGLGTYNYCITSTNSNNALNDTSCFDFDVTATGDKLSTPQGLIYVILFIVSIFLFLGCLWGSIKVKWKNPRNDENEVIGTSDLKYAKMFFIVFSYVLLVWLSWLGWNISFGYLSFSLMANLFKTIYYVLFSLMWPIIVIAFVVMVIRMVDDIKIGKLIDRGVTLRG